MLLLNKYRYHTLSQILVLLGISFKIFFVALPYDDWCYCIDPIYPNTSAMHERRWSCSRSYYINYDIRNGYSDVYTSYIWLQVCICKYVFIIICTTRLSQGLFNKNKALYLISSNVFESCWFWYVGNNDNLVPWCFSVWQILQGWKMCLYWLHCYILFWFIYLVALQMQWLF